MTQKQAGDWIPLMDYAMKKGVSLSTLRRHIKSNKIEYRVEHGRYLLFDDGLGDVGEAAFAPPAQKAPQASSAHTDASALHVKPRSFQAQGASAPTGSVDETLRLRRELQMAREEIAELKMLVALYEDQLPGPRIDN